MDLAGVFVLAVALGIVGGIGAGSIAIVRWARRAGRRSWLWLVGAYVAANIAWALVSASIR
jgi:hypothetical protein